MRLINGIIYYTTGDIAVICCKSVQSIINWDKYSTMLETQEKKRLIPKAMRVNGIRLYSQQQANFILKFSKNIRRGDIAEWSNTRSGKQGKEIIARKEEKKRIAHRDICDIVSRGRQASTNELFKQIKKGNIEWD